jgi:hypothetical protein
MSPDQQGNAKQSSNDRHTELIISRLTEYLSIRFNLAERINPHLKSIKQDLLFHELANVRLCLMATKAYGPIRFGVADILMGDDDKKRRSLLSPTDQSSIQVELVSHCQDERVESTRGQIRIHDLKTFYAALNPELSDMIDLLETWIWWDLPESAELARFEQKLGVIARVRQGGLPPEMRKRYATIILSTGEEETVMTTVSDEDILRYELTQLVHIRDQWKHRRGNELGYMCVLKRDKLPSPDEEELIHAIAERVREYDAIETAETITDEIQHRYAPDLKTAPQKITKEVILTFIKSRLMAVEREMVEADDPNQRLGQPYNFKNRQGEQMDKVLADVALQLKPLLQQDLSSPPPIPAGEPAATSTPTPSS